MKSLKIKFTITLTLVIFSVLVLFSVIIFFVSVNTKINITPEVLQRFSINRPALQKLVEKIDQNQTINLLADQIRQEDQQKYIQTLLILIPPTLAFSALTGYLISLYLIRPIEDLAVRISYINRKNISDRVSTKKSSSEIEYLVTSFNSLLDSLEKSFLQQDQLIQDAAHELRTPIAAIKATIQVFNEEKDHSLHDYQKLVKRIENINNKLVHLNEDLLILNSRDNTNLQNTNLSDLIEDIIEMILFKAEEKNIKINFDYSENVFAMIDPNQFAIAIKNILENSIKYSNPNTCITIKLCTEKNTKIITIQDEGFGISKQDQEKIFDRFYRSDKTDKEEGIGLGLSITKKILENHNAKIVVSSELNKGSLFRIEI